MLSLIDLWGRSVELNTEDIYNLVVAVLPTFTAIAERTRNTFPDPSESEPSTITATRDFYNLFNAHIFNLNAVLVVWDPTEIDFGSSEEESTVQKNLIRILDELESRFLSWKSEEAGSACRRLGLQRREDRTYPKLRALKRILPEDGNLSEAFLNDLDRIVRISNGRTSKREKLLQNLQQALDFFYDLQPFTVDSDSPCPIRFSNYPLRHVRKLARTLFDVLERNWRCQCSPPHVSRRTRLSLTQYQRFEMAPTHEQADHDSKATFRILFPTSSRNLEWQDTEIAIKNRDQERSEHEEVKQGLCGILQGVKAGIRPRMVVYVEKLWQLESDVERNRSLSPQIRDNDFKSLKELLRSAQSSSHGSLMSSIDRKDRLILSFILATSVLHFFKRPWLQASLNSDNICFLVSHSRLSPDITQPYLTMRYVGTTSRPEVRKLSQPHRFPDILSLGILLLEIARGTRIEFDELQDRCVVALECFDKWATTSSARNNPDGLFQAILACIDPKEFRKSNLDKASIKDPDVMKYIFERVLFPLDNALSTVYKIQSNRLHVDIDRSKKVHEVGSFDHNDEIGLDKKQAAQEWTQHLEGVHDMFYDCIDKCEHLSDADQRATRVKIAVLDTGLQLPESLQENYIDEGKIAVEASQSFLPGTKGDAWNMDCDGHGSQVGQIILKVAPAADLHVARVFKDREYLANPNTAVQVHKSIAEAIDRATNKWRVDMIVMCFGFDEPITVIRNAIERASKAEKPPLFFAATRNDGAHRRIAWPARDPLVIGVSSTAGDGDASPFNPLDKDAHPILYAFGEGVPISVTTPSEPQKQYTKYISGTSYATPVAAGLAANLLGCVRMMVNTSSPEDQHMYKHLPLEIQRLSGMLAVLRHRMCKEHNSGISSLLPWDFLTQSQLENNKLLEQVSETLKEF